MPMATQPRPEGNSTLLSPSSKAFPPLTVNDNEPSGQSLPKSKTSMAGPPQLDLGDLNTTFDSDSALLSSSSSTASAPHSPSSSTTVQTSNCIHTPPPGFSVSSQCGDENQQEPHQQTPPVRPQCPQPPQIQPSSTTTTSIWEDLFRRQISINSLQIELNKRQAEENDRQGTPPNRRPRSLSD